jgi:hypothetical protein
MYSDESLSSRCLLECNSIHPIRSMSEMRHNRWGAINDCGSIPSQDRRSKARSIDHQGRQLFISAKSTVLTTTKAIRLARWGLSDEARATHTVGIGSLLARMEIAKAR